MRWRRKAWPGSETGRVAVLAAALVVGVVADRSAAAKSRKSEVEIRFVNGIYENLAVEPRPVKQGPLTVKVSSPEHRLTVHGNRLRLERNGDGTIDASMEVDFEGRGRLVADITGIGRFNDDVEAPRQTVHASGTVRIESVQGGYLFTVVEAEPSVALEIESGVARQVVGACRTAAMIPLLRLPCDGLDAALTSINVPLPEPGKQVLLPSAEMTRKERAFFNRFAAP